MTKYVVDVQVEVDLEGPEMFDEAHRLVDETLQRAWDTDRGRSPHLVRPWHFSILEDAVVELEPEPDQVVDGARNVTDVSADTGGLAT